MNNFTIGCDPGINGALALLKDDTLLDVWDIPTTEKIGGKGKMISSQLLNLVIGEIKNICEGYGDSYVLCANIELVNAYRQGSTSAFSFGRSVGVIDGVIAVHNVPINYVTPQKWKKQFGLIKKDKDMARTLVIQKFPEKADLFKRKKDADRADATLIGMFKE